MMRIGLFEQDGCRISDDYFEKEEEREKEVKKE
jgi:hypothetical protein